MAKKKDTAYEDFLADLKAINPQIEEILKDDKVSAKIREGVLARADYSAKMDDMNSYLAEERRKIEEWQKWYGEATTEFATLQTQLNRYKDEFGDLSDSQQRKVAAKVGLTAEEFQAKLDAELQKRDVASLKFMEDLTEIKIDHRERFKEKLDTDAVYKLAGEKQLSLRQAYNEHIAEREEELRKADIAAQIAKAKEEGAREALSKHNLPHVDSNPTLQHVLDVKDVGRTSDSRISAAVAAWQQAQRR